jgi:hypothetical protein
MFTPIRKEDRKVTPYEVNKQFSAQYYGGIDTASDLGIMHLSAITGSLQGNPGFVSSSAPVNTFVNSDNETLTIYKEPLYRQIKFNFFEFARGDNRIRTVPQPQYVLDSNSRPFGHPKGTGSEIAGTYVPDYDTLGLRRIYDKVNVVSIPQKLFGEGILSGSLELTDYSNGSAITIVDDGYGNLYDQAYETEFQNATPTADGSGSSLGVVSYDHGLVMISTTGSYYTNVAEGSDATGWKLKFNAKRTIYEHEYTCIVPKEQYNATMNISTIYQRSGSLTIPSSSAQISTLRHILPPAEFAYSTTGYNASNITEPFVTHSFFAPYITTIGLYNDHGDLLAIAKTSRALRNDPEIAMSFVIKFDI